MASATATKPASVSTPKVQGIANAAKIKLNQEEYDAFKAWQKVKQGEFLPAKVVGTAADTLKGLVDKGVLHRSGQRGGSKYQVMVTDADISDERAPSRKTRAKRGSRKTSAALIAPNNRVGVIEIYSTDREQLRNGIREYLAAASGSEARKHEERRQSPDIVDAISARAKEMLAEVKAGNRSPLTPVQAMHEAENEIAGTFEDSLRKRFGKLLFDIFGVMDLADTDSKTMRG